VQQKQQQTIQTTDSAAFMNCSYLLGMGMEASYCKGCGDFPARAKAACAEAGPTNDNCTDYYNGYCSSYLGGIIKLADAGACQNDCRKQATCDKCGAVAGCTWSTVGCATSTVLAELQKTNEMYKPGGFFGCTWWGPCTS
jgi:hypothetical protein